MRGIDSFPFTSFWLLVFTATKALSFHLRTSTFPVSRNNCRPSYISMSWKFSVDETTNQKESLQGKDGEYYYVPGTNPKWDGPRALVSKSMTMPLFPRNSLLLPEATEYLTIYDLRFRQLFNAVGVGGYFGCIYASPEYSKYGLVGTIARVNQMERLDDGAMYLKITGQQRFFIREMLQDRPYPVAKVQYLYDGVNDHEEMKILEYKLFHQLRHSIKLLKRIYPENNYTLSDLVYKNRPYHAIFDTREVRDTSSPTSDASETSLLRQSLFSYGAMNLLKTDAITKLLFLQESILDKRYKRISKVLFESNQYLKGEVQKRFGLSDEELQEIWYENIGSATDFDEYETRVWSSSFSPEKNAANVNSKKPTDYWKAKTIARVKVANDSTKTNNSFFNSNNPSNDNNQEGEEEEEQGFTMAPIMMN